MTRVLVVSDLWLPFPGGAERLIYNVSRSLMRDGHCVAAITGYESARQFDGPTVWARELHLDARGWAMIEAAITAHEPDVLLTHHVYARAFHDQLVDTGLPIVQLVLNGERMPDAALAVYISEHVRSQCADRPGDLTIMPWAESDVIADTHGDAIGFIKPIEHKGVDLFVEIVERLPQYRFVVLRGEWQTLERIVEHPSIEYLEPVVDIRDFWKRCRAVLVPSISEDAGTVAQEATANGLPCISSAVDGLLETNRGGIRLRSRDVDTWATAIELLDTPWRARLIVDSQRAALAEHDHPQRLAQLSAAITALGV